MNELVCVLPEDKVPEFIVHTFDKYRNWFACRRSEVWLAVSCFLKPKKILGGRERGTRFSFRYPHWSRSRRSDVRVAGSGLLYSNVIMAALGVIVDGLVAFWRKPAARQNIHWIFLVLALVGSVAKELELVPQTYFSHSRNAVNVWVMLTGRWLAGVSCPGQWMGRRKRNSSTSWILSMVDDSQWTPWTD